MTLSAAVPDPTSNSWCVTARATAGPTDYNRYAGMVYGWRCACQPTPGEDLTQGCFI
jgi:hypothetical protein